MFSLRSKKIQSVILTSLMVLLGASLVACDSQPPKLMKAVKQFESDEIRDAHVKDMRKNHMDELLHKRDETMYNGIRTEKHSLKACINCHVPEQHNGKILRHTDSEHFCSTCHGYVAAQLDCFECHVDHPVSDKLAEAPKDEIHNKAHKNTFLQKPSQKQLVDQLTIELAKVTIDAKTITAIKTKPVTANDAIKGDAQ